MVYDYLLGGVAEAPMAFAKRFYDHYPKVALGNWPPGFYLIQSVWMLAFGSGTVAVMGLMAAFQWGLAMTVFEVARRHLGVGSGWVAAIILLLLPLNQKYAAMVMTEMPVALLMLLATLIFSRFLERPGWACAIAFGIVASCAILVKGSALALAAVPLLGPLLAGQGGVFRRYSWWAAGGVVVVVCLPWTWFTLDLARAGWEGSAPFWDFTARALRYYPEQFVGAIGVVVAIPAVKGYRGFGAMADTLLQEALNGGAGAGSVLVSSDARGEGMAIAEVARRDDRPGWIVRRSSKSLAVSTWSGLNYNLRFASTDELAAHLRGGSYRYLVIDDSIPENRVRPHHRLLASVVEASPPGFNLVASFPVTRQSVVHERALRLYRISQER
jgi:hypothetical protein